MKETDGATLIVWIIAKYGVSYLVCAGLVKLITLCFELAFTWKLTTGVWLVIFLVNIVTNLLNATLYEEE
jgi:hypothetical protein